MSDNRIVHILSADIREYLLFRYDLNPLTVKERHLNLDRSRIRRQCSQLCQCDIKIFRLFACCFYEFGLQIVWNIVWLVWCNWLSCVIHLVYDWCLTVWLEGVLLGIWKFWVLRAYLLAIGVLGWVCYRVYWGIVLIWGRFDDLWRAIGCLLSY